MGDITDSLTDRPDPGKAGQPIDSAGAPGSLVDALQWGVGEGQRAHDRAGS